MFSSGTGVAGVTDVTGSTGCISFVEVHAVTAKNKKSESVKCVFKEAVFIILPLRISALTDCVYYQYMHKNGENLCMSAKSEEISYN